MSNFNIELQTSGTFLPSPRVELNELKHPKKVELRTRTQVCFKKYVKKENAYIYTLEYVLVLYNS